MSFALALLLLVAQETTTATAPPPPPKPKAVESDLVKASRAAKAKKVTSTKKPITNADLKKAKTKLLTYDPGPVTATETTASTATTDTRGPLAKDDERYHARQAAEVRVNADAAKVSDLEKELDRVEQSYYNTNDPNERDTVIAKRFAQTKKQLEDARKELADARDALAALK